MPFNTKSYLAGVGTVVAALTIGFSGGFFLAPSTEHMEQNRLQRVTTSAPISNPAPQTTVTPKLEVAATNATPTAALQPPPRMIPVMAKAVEPTPAPAAPKAIEPAQGAFEDRAIQPNSERMRAAEERKRTREERRAERRKQREIELAAVAVKRMLRDRDPQQVADRTESPRFGFFGED